MIKSLDYFGTALNVAGHYFWKLEGASMNKSNVYFQDIPFNPEELVNNCNKGTVKYFVFGEYKVCAISGSCIDNRLGTKSVFWTTEDIKLGDFKEIINSIPAAKVIIDKMQFDIEWNVQQEENKQPRIRVVDLNILEEMAKEDGIVVVGSTSNAYKNGYIDAIKSVLEKLSSIENTKKTLSDVYNEGCLSKHRIVDDQGKSKDNYLSNLIQK